MVKLLFYQSYFYEIPLNFKLIKNKNEDLVRFSKGFECISSLGYVTLDDVFNLNSIFVLTYKSISIYHSP